MFPVLVPHAEHLVNQFLVGRVPIGVGVDDGLHAFRVEHWLDAGLVVANEVIVELDAARLLLL